MLIPNGDFMFLQGEPAGDSIVSFFPKDIGLSLLCFAGIVVVLFALVSLPQIIREIKAKKASKQMVEPQKESDK